MVSNKLGKNERREATDLMLASGPTVTKGSFLGIKLTRQTLQVAARDALVALAFAAVLALMLASLSAAGIIAMGTAIFELAGAFAIGAFVTLLSDLKGTWKAAITIALGVGLFALGWYEDKNFVPPLTKNDVKQAVQDGSFAHPFDSPDKCPAGYDRVSHGEFYDAKEANVSIPKGAHICFFDLKAHGSNSGVNFEVRGH